MKKDFGLIFWIHLLLIIIAITSFLWVDWKIIFIGVVLLQIQWMVLGGCFLTHMEDKNASTFHYYYLSKIFKNLDEKMVRTCAQTIAPIVIVAAAYVLQVYFQHKPLLTI